MTFNPIRPEYTVTFIKYITSVVPLVFPLKTLVWNRMLLHAFFYKRHFHKQHQAEIDKKIKQTFRSFHPRYHPDIIVDILKYVQKTIASVLVRLYN